MYPFKQKKVKNKLIREFSSDVDSEELVWHRDRSNRKVKVISGSGWQIQLENKLPVILEKGETYYIPAREYHRVIKGKTNLVLEISEESSGILIPPPPKNEYRIKELDQIQHQYHNRFNPESIQVMMDDIHYPFDIILTKNGFKSQKSLIKNISKSIVPIIVFHKNHFNSERPYELANINGIQFKSDYLDSAQSPSYPSGHTAQAYYIAEKLSSMYPGLRKKFLTLANMISQSRIDRGVHFPSDIAGGKILAYKIIENERGSN